MQTGPWRFEFSGTVFARKRKSCNNGIQITEIHCHVSGCHPPSVMALFSSPCARSLIEVPILNVVFISSFLCVVVVILVLVLCVVIRTEAKTHAHAHAHHSNDNY